jgi:UDP-2,4-diacetamido-2,4,6-trideoxy-beta-L-altropyranose hydrolase
MPEITLRYASEADAGDLYTWRNSPEARKYSFDPSPLCWETHVDWLHRVLQNRQCRLLVGEINGVPIGVIRFDLDGDVAEVSTYLVPGKHGKGLGTALIRAGSRWMQLNVPTVRSIVAKILEANIASLKAFERAGFHGHQRVMMLSL